MSRRRNGGERFCHKTLESYKLVLDSMVNFLGASGALIRQRIESGQIPSNIDCEPECLSCSPGKMCPECLQKPQQQSQQPEDKMPLRECAADCAAGKTVSRHQSQDASSSSTLVNKSEGTVQEVQGVVEEPAPIVVEEPKPSESTSEQVAIPSGKDSSVCVCAQIRKIRETASKVGVQPNESKSFDKSIGKKCACKAKGQSIAGNFCACPPSSKEKAELEGIIVDRLNTVSKLVDLVRVDLTNLSGRSKSAALYKEIMKEGSPLAVPQENTPPMRTGPRYPLTSTPLEPGNIPVRRRLFDDPGVSPVTANERDAARRTPTPASLFSSDWNTESGTSSNPQPLPFDHWANFVQCIFQRKKQRPNFTEPSIMPSHNDARYRGHLVGPPGPAYQSARRAGPTVCTRGEPGLGYGNLQRQPVRNLADSQQYRQMPIQMQFYRSTSANRPQSSGVSEGSSREPRNFENLQRARANFPAVSNIAGVSTSSSGGVQYIDGDRYGDLQGARNRFGPVADVCAEMYSESGLQPIQTATNYAVSYQDLCSDNNCDNDECVAR